MNSFSVMNDLRPGAFLTVKDGSKANTMTIGWGLEGIMWQRKVFAALIKDIHRTYELLENAKYFTVSFPQKGTFTEALRHFGSVSGKTADKYESGLVRLTDAQSVDGFLIDGCIKHYECEVIYKQLLQREFFTVTIDPSHLHTDENLHTLIIGEIKNPD